MHKKFLQLNLIIFQQTHEKMALDIIIKIIQ